MKSSPVEPSAMAKTQKTFYLNDDLGKLVAVIEQRSGASFTRIVTAALICYLFEGFKDSEPASPDSPNTDWMSLAMDLERGKVTVDNIPSTVLAIDVKRGTVSEDDASALKVRKEKCQGWKNSLEDFGGLVGAYDFVIRGAFPPYLKKPFASEDEKK